MAQPLLKIKGLKKYFPIRTGVFRRVTGQIKAVDGIDFTINEGETLGLVGESGCGKSTTAKTIMKAYQPTAGEMLFRENNEWVDIAKVEKKGLEQIYRDIQIIFQDPFSSLNPRMTVLQIIGEPLICNDICSGDELEERVKELLVKVGLKPQHLNRYPHAFSGGQRQRIAIARALAVNPKLIIADEAVSALDVSIQAQIINLMKDLQNEINVSYLFIAHDLSVVKYISDRIAVMYVGNIMELTDSETLFLETKHPYTEALLSAVPIPDPRRKSDRIILEGKVPDPSSDFAGCKFVERCDYAQEKCRTQIPELKNISENSENEHWVACHYPLEVSNRILKKVK